jgi:hypothetical protein
MSDTAGRVFLVETTEQTMRITVPEGFKLTFGPLQPFETKVSRYSAEKPVSSTAIRIYRAKDDPVMVIPHVVSFREIGPLKIEVMDVDKSGNEAWKEDTKGVIERAQRRRRQVASALMKNPNEVDLGEFAVFKAV